MIPSYYTNEDELLLLAWIMESVLTNELHSTRKWEFVAEGFWDPTIRAFLPSCVLQWTPLESVACFVSWKTNGSVLQRLEDEFSGGTREKQVGQCSTFPSIQLKLFSLELYVSTFQM